MSDLLESHARHVPDKAAFAVLDADTHISRQISFLQLALEVRQSAACLYGKGLTGHRALLVYHDTVEFAIAFLACLRTGIVAVPMPNIQNQKQFSRLLPVMQDAQVTAILCQSRSVGLLRDSLSAVSGLEGIELIETDVRRNTEPQSTPSVRGDIVFIQYTSGSTGDPKGVTVSTQSLMANQLLLRETFGCDSQSVLFSWLPFHHDMGLVGNILHTVYIGCTCYLMSGYLVMQSPVRWLRAISRYRVTHSGGPNFSYDLCIDRISPEEDRLLDLSCWKVAFNGSEPVRASTLARFVERFGQAGFDANAFFPCYGLAEATLLVAGRKEMTSKALELRIERTTNEMNRVRIVDKPSHLSITVVSAGGIPTGVKLMIIANDGLPCSEMEVGEISIAGESVTKGYWNRDNASFYVESEGKFYFRTGDSGFLYSGQLFIFGRLKEMFIVRGHNFYPADIEEALGKSHVDIVNNGIAVFDEGQDEERIVVVAEVKRFGLRAPDLPGMIACIENTVRGNYGLSLADIVFTSPMAIPRTTSGKVQRSRCKHYYQHDLLNIVGSRSMQAIKLPYSRDDRILARVLEHPNLQSVTAYLLETIRYKFGVAVDLNADLSLAELGVDSLRLMELINLINKDICTNVEVGTVLESNTISGLATTLTNLLWLKKTPLSGEYIII